jgi:ribosomal protein S18 acetylase RimI-like enzyme
MPTGVDDATAAADALWAALEEFASLPRGHVVDAGDARLVVSEQPYANFNNVMATFIDAAAADRRIAAILGAFPDSSVPLTWWAGPTTRPADLGTRLQRLGLARQEPQFAMALDIDAGWPDAVLPTGATLETVDDDVGLDLLLRVMNVAYGWPDPSRTAMIRAMYLADLRRPLDERRTRHYIVRVDGTAAATSSLFVGGGHAFVTNIGTHPDARGQGLGTAATVATLALARDLGRSRATLIASIDGRGVYRRLGFRDAGVMERYVATAQTIQQAAGR